MASQVPDSVMAEDARPTFSDLQGGNIYAISANTHWLNQNTQTRFSSKVVKEIYSALEHAGFPRRDLLLLENLQYMERYLWPNYDEDSTDELVISLVMMAVTKKRESIPLWGNFENNPALFSAFFRRVLIMTVSESLPLASRTHILSFITSAFQSLDHALVRRECAPLVSIGIWQNLHSEAAREFKLNESSQFKKAWRASERKRLALIDQRSRVRLSFERSWLSSIVLQFITIIYSAGNDNAHKASLYAERIVEFLSDLLSQLPTRRYAHGLLEDLQIIPCIRLSPVYTAQENRLFRDLVALLEHFYYHEDGLVGDPVKGTPLADTRYRRNIERLQNAALQISKGKLTVLGLANHASIGQKDDLRLQLSTLDDQELEELYKYLLLRKSYPEGIACTIDRRFMLCAIAETFAKRPSPVDLVRDSSILPTEGSLMEHFLHSEDYGWEHPVPVPKLNIQYLSIPDFFWRAFSLHRAESFFEILRDVQDTLRKLKPTIRGGSVVFTGNSKMAVQINRLSILEEARPKVGEILPAQVRAELLLEFGTVSEGTKREWETLRPDDVVFLLSIRSPSASFGRGFGIHTSTGDNLEVSLLRSAEVVQFVAENKSGSFPTTERRKIHIRLDREAYMIDKQNTEFHTDIYSSFNILLRRKSVENNFKAVLTSIQSIIEDPPSYIPEWLHDTFLGCGDPSEACFPKLRPIPKKIHLGETFLDSEHLQATLPKISSNFHIPALGSLKPPFTITELETAPILDNAQAQDNATQYPYYTVSTSNTHLSVLASKGKGSTNSAVKYTPAQVKAILSGTNPGLSMIVGPPGTGKTDVATQIICNLYSNFPRERTLVIAHSNQSLNQIFQKLAVRDIDERHLLRLGHADDDSEQLTPSQKHTKLGRIESLNDLRFKLLEQVDRLSLSIGAPGAHSNSCETASYFYRIYVKPLWEKFSAKVAQSPDPNTVLNEFPFTDYFLADEQNALPIDTTFESIMNSAEFRFQQISKIFSQLDDLMPFELLRNGRDKANYLLSTEARIIAMTSTHAAMKRDDIMRHGFQYHNVIMEEAAQISEAETLIPLTLQTSSEGISPIKRVILCGDHLQNSPVIQSAPLRYYANMEQSLFARFVRLGVPLIGLDKQGRARPSIASLYNWRYSGLGDLDYLHQEPDFLRANAGFRHELQFINVDDFKGHGEQEPTPHFIQNLGEAEYSVALFQYMRLLGYPASKISILSSYAGQRALIRDIVDHRCTNNPLFGSPAHITTIDKFQGEQNDYIIVSLVRTKRVGYLRDMRRLTVGLSRARLGLYILGRLRTFQTCYELKDAFVRLLEFPTKLALTTGEMWPTERLLTDPAQATTIEGVEHLGKYVFEMTESKLAALRKRS